MLVKSLPLLHTRHLPDHFRASKKGHFTHISVSKLMLKQSQLCASSELTQISDKLHTITAVESTIVVTITKLQITNINKIRILKVY